MSDPPSTVAVDIVPRYVEKSKRGIDEIREVFSDPQIWPNGWRQKERLFFRTMGMFLVNGQLIFLERNANMVHIISTERMRAMLGFGFDRGFALFQIMFFLFFLVFIVVFVTVLVKGIGQWNKNNHSPRLTVPVTVVSKRTNVSHRHHANAGDATGTHGYHTSTDTDYYVTFQVESGDRMELHVSGSQYGLIVEGDRGLLTFQGTRFLDFQRQF